MLSAFAVCRIKRDVTKFLILLAGVSFRFRLLNVCMAMGKHDIAGLHILKQLHPCQHSVTSKINIASPVRLDGLLDPAGLRDRNAHDDLVELRCRRHGGLCGRTLVVALETDSQHDVHDDRCANLKQTQLLKFLDIHQIVKCIPPPFNQPAASPAANFTLCID